MQVEIIDPQGNVSYRRPHDQRRNRGFLSIEWLEAVLVMPSVLVSRKTKLMGWITNRSMRRGGSLYEGGPKRKGPLKRVVGVLSGDYGTNLFGSDRVLLECGHVSTSYGGKRAICPKCLEGKPMDLENAYGVNVPETIARWQASTTKLRQAAHAGVRLPTQMRPPLCLQRVLGIVNNTKI